MCLVFWEILLSLIPLVTSNTGKNWYLLSIKISTISTTYGYLSITNVEMLSRSAWGISEKLKNWFRIKNQWIKESKHLLARFVPSKFVKWYKLTLPKTVDEDFLFSCDFQLFPALFKKYKRFILVIDTIDWIIFTIYC